MKPPFSSVGMTATHSAEPSTSSGIPWSGAPWISSRTVAADSTLLLALVSASAAERTLVSRQKDRARMTSFRIMPRLGDKKYLQFYRMRDYEAKASWI